jgi:hypothetical protein
MIDALKLWPRYLFSIEFVLPSGNNISAWTEDVDSIGWTRCVDFAVEASTFLLDRELDVGVW